MTTTFSVVPFMSVFKFNGNLFYRSGTNTATNIFTKDKTIFEPTDKVIILT